MSVDRQIIITMSWFSLRRWINLIFLVNLVHPQSIDDCFRTASKAWSKDLVTIAAGGDNLKLRTVWDKALLARANNFDCPAHGSNNMNRVSSKDNASASSSISAEIKKEPPPRLTDEFLSRFLLVPEHKLLFCWIDKVGSKAFNQLFRDVRRAANSTLLAEEAAGIGNGNSTRNNNTLRSVWRQNRAIEDHGVGGKEGLAEILADPAWHKAVFYRGEEKKAFLVYTPIVAVLCLLSPFSSQQKGFHAKKHAVSLYLLVQS